MSCLTSPLDRWSVLCSLQLCIDFDPRKDPPSTSSEVSVKGNDYKEISGFSVLEKLLPGHWEVAVIGGGRLVSD